MGYGIEPGIFDTAVGLNALGINTNQSCEGHLDRARVTPWVDVESPNRPEQFKDENKISKQIYQEVADELRLPAEEVERSSTERGKKGWLKVQKRLAKIFKKQPETPEYMQWNEENKKNYQRVNQLLEEFYRGRKISVNERIRLSRGWKNGFGIYNGQNDYMTAEQKRTERQKQNLAKRLEKYRKEFKEFSEFLKNKYLSE